MKRSVWIFMLFLSATRVYSGNYGGGSGSTDDPFLICSAAQLDELGTSPGDWDKSFKLMENMDLSSYTDTAFHRIGISQAECFSGNFDGNHRTITGFHYTDGQIDADFVGLFGCIGNGGKVFDLNMTDVDITGWKNVGAIAGNNFNGSITGCFVSGIIKGRTNVGGIAGLDGNDDTEMTGDGNIENCRANVAVQASSGVAGGIVGYHLGTTLKDCHARGSVNIATGNFAGGIAGSMIKGTITNCSFTGTVLGRNALGGIVGAIDDYCGIVNCVSSGAVSANGGGANQGGIVGSSNKNTGYISHGISKMVISGINADNIGGIAGMIVGSSVSHCQAFGKVVGKSKVGGVIGHLNTGQCLHTSAFGSVEGVSNYVGGAVGYNNRGLISQCAASGDAQSTTLDYVGGLCGFNYMGTILNSCATGKALGQKYIGGLLGSNWGAGDTALVQHCYCAGAVTGTQYVGGFVGFNYKTVSVLSYANIINSFWDNQTSQQTTGAGQNNGELSTLFDKTTLEMKSMITYTAAGWDFTNEAYNGSEDIWAICEAENYPRLSGRTLAGDWLCPDGVGLEDLYYFVDHWMAQDDLSALNCGNADLNLSGTVDLIDYASLSENWLEGAQ